MQRSEMVTMMRHDVSAVSEDEAPALNDDLPEMSDSESKSETHEIRI